MTFSAILRKRCLQPEPPRSGFYYSLGEFNHSLYLKARQPGGDLQPFVREHMQPQLREAVSRYNPSIIYFDGEWEFPLDSFEMKDFLSWLYNDSPCRNEVWLTTALERALVANMEVCSALKPGCEKVAQTTNGVKIVPSAGETGRITGWKS